MHVTSVNGEASKANYYMGIVLFCLELVVVQIIIYSSSIRLLPKSSETCQFSVISLSPASCPMAARLYLFFV